MRLVALVLLCLSGACGHPAPVERMPDPVQMTDDDWKGRLTPLQYEITRLKGTERPGTGEYLHTDTPGTYRCVCCGLELFDSDAKYDAGCGWPSFFSATGDNVSEQRDTSHGMVRTEIVCRRCGAHLGHVFPDGPQPTGRRFCVNSASLRLDPK